MGASERPLLRDDYTPEEMKSIFLHADYWEAQYDKSQAELAEATARVIIPGTDVIECMLGDDGIWQCSLREWQKRPHAYAHDEDAIVAIRKAASKIAPTPGPEDDDDSR